MGGGNFFVSSLDHVVAASDCVYKCYPQLSKQVWSERCAFNTVCDVSAAVRDVISLLLTLCLRVDYLT